jgi:hypothetical protein
MKISRVRLFGLSLLLLALSTLPVFAANIRMVRLSIAQGDVEIDRNAGEGWEQAIVNMPVIGGAKIYAAEQSRAELEFEDGSSVRLAGPAQITITELSTNPKGAPVNVIQVNSGEVYVNARLAHKSDFRITDAEGSSFAITKPSRLRFTVDQQTASMAMMNGEAIMQDSDAKVLTGKTYNYVLGQPGSAASLGKVPALPEDAWNQKRETYNDQYASTGAQFSGSDDPDAYGNADLGKYGNYAEVPDYGVMWQPNDVGPDWNPYDNGAWSYYPDWGWTFVSGYDWGWAPFYYGDWCYINGRGWWWRPGPWRGGPGHGRSGGWHAQPLYSGHPGANWHAPHPPSSTAAHTTVAVAGSHLHVGPIAQTHESAAMTSGARTIGSSGGAMPTHGFTGHAGVPAGGPAGRVGVSSSLVRGSVVVGHQGSYSLANGVHTEYNGHEVHGPTGSQGGGALRGPGNALAGSSGPTPRAYSGSNSGPSGSIPVTHMSVSNGGSAAPHASGGGGGHVSGGGGGGGSHGGGGGGGGGHR